jgi:hypothetical protein
VTLVAVVLLLANVALVAEVLLLANVAFVAVVLLPATLPLVAEVLLLANVALVAEVLLLTNVALVAEVLLLANVVLVALLGPGLLVSVFAFIATTVTDNTNKTTREIASIFFMLPNVCFLIYPLSTFCLYRYN